MQTLPALLAAVRSRTFALIAAGLLASAAPHRPAASAEDRFILPAPAPGRTSAADYHAWLSLSRRLLAVLEQPSRLDHPATEALAVCTAILRTPVDRAPSPAAHASLAQKACAKALELVPPCRAANPTEKVRLSWERAFQQVYVDPAAEHCGRIDDARRASEYGGAHGLAMAAGAVELALPELVAGDAHDSLEPLLAEAPCERARDLRRALAGLPSDVTVRKILSATSTEALLQRWAEAATGGGRYQDVVAFHLAEAVIALRGDTEALYDVASREASLPDVEAASELANCLAEHDKRTDLARRARQLRRSLLRERRARERELEEWPTARACCKTCNRGYACGDSCISRAKQCHQPPGCACDG